MYLIMVQEEGIYTSLKDKSGNILYFLLSHPKSHDEYTLLTSLLHVAKAWYSLFSSKTFKNTQMSDAVALAALLKV